MGDDRDQVTGWRLLTGVADRGERAIGAASKYDYVFFSDNHARDRVSGLAGDLGASDHHIYRAFADLTF